MTEETYWKRLAKKYAYIQRPKPEITSHKWVDNDPAYREDPMIPSLIRQFNTGWDRKAA